MSVVNGQHALVTGGGSGIGAAVAEALLAKGATVSLLGRNKERLAATAAELGVTFEAADVTDSGQLRDAISGLQERNGRLTILINNAGMAEAAPFVKLTDSDWDRTLAVNLTGVFNCTHAVIGGMLEGGFGRIVNVASMASLKGYAYVSAYCAAKHGVLGLTRALAQEYVKKNITVNAVCPGYTDTPMVEQAVENIVATTGRSPEEALAELVKNNPQRRLIQPAEVAETVVWLCEQESINGQAIAVAGGEAT